MGQITFKNGGSITFKDGSITFLSYPPMAEPEVTAYWEIVDRKYKSWVKIVNSDTEEARIFFRTNGSPWIYADLLPGQSTIQVVYNSSTLPNLNTETIGEAYATEIDDLRPSSSIVNDTALSYWHTPMANPTVKPFWLFTGGQYVSRVSITNNDTETANMWYRVNDAPSAGEYESIAPGETKTFTGEQYASMPLTNTQVKGEAQALDINDSKGLSSTVTNTASWNPKVANPTVAASWSGGGGIYHRRVTVTNNDAQSATFYADLFSAPTTSYGTLAPGETKTVIINSTSSKPDTGQTFIAYVQMKATGRDDSNIITRTSSGSTW